MTNPTPEAIAAAIALVDAKDKYADFDASLALFKFSEHDKERSDHIAARILAAAYRQQLINRDRTREVLIR